ncbi:unnamed protein product [Prorocentrum cordatum]|uniref:Ribosome biogenesis protein NOP53 n=1 Tax=Prorocentrum cordatum TaxID=2364126 RepID=A0ABN9VKT9_9DINO|nr:unnamed protein product [Polarella glacialis]
MAEPSPAEAAPGDGDEERQPFDTNADVLPSERRKEPAAPETEEKKISKRKQRKLEQLAKKKESRELRSGVLDELKGVQLTPEQALLMRSSQSVRLSRREKVAVAKRHVALGVPVPEDLLPLRRRAEPGPAEGAKDGEDGAHADADPDETSVVAVARHSAAFRRSPCPHPRWAMALRPHQSTLLTRG